MEVSDVDRANAAVRRAEIGHDEGLRDIRHLRDIIKKQAETILDLERKVKDVGVP
ncbi:MAG TPA: hypothetical protein VJW93_01645 [Candidatus Acidoferrales bacterium]|jgi:hypothetical protein|nr:hypothetical protein [Candidatus Acidoferrales bacterium]